MLRVVMAAAARERAKAAAAVLLHREGAANTLQKSVRARQLRRAFQDTTSALLDRERRKAYSDEARRQVERQQQAVEAAATRIQRRNRVVTAKRQV